MIDFNLTANILGVAALLCSIIAFLPSLINLYRKKYRYTKSLLVLSRFSLIIAVCLGLIHGLLTTQLENIDFYNLNTYWVYAEGFFAFNILVFLVFTFTEFKSDLKKLNYFSYGALFLLVCHIGQQIIPAF